MTPTTDLQSAVHPAPERKSPQRRGRLHHHLRRGLALLGLCAVSATAAADPAFLEPMDSAPVQALKAQVERAAPFDSAAAAYELALIYTWGRDGVRRHEAEALHWMERYAALRKAQVAAIGNAPWRALCVAQTAYRRPDGHCLLTHPDTDNYLRTLNTWVGFEARDKARAQAGAPVESVAAMRRLGLQYTADRNGGRRDDLQALYWLKRYEQVLAEQLQQLGRREFNALCKRTPAHRTQRTSECRYTEEDDAETRSIAQHRQRLEAAVAAAQALLARAADCDSGACSLSAAELRLVASHHESGLVLPRDATQAFRWHLRAAEAGDAEAMARLGLMYEQGLGTAKDLPLAQRWLQQALAAAPGTPGALSASAGKGASEALARVAMQVTAQAGNADPQAMYAHGIRQARRGVEGLNDEDYAWVQKAAEAGHAEAAWRLRDEHTFRRGINRQNEAKARHWLERAAALGHPEAMYTAWMGLRRETTPELQQRAQDYLQRAAALNLPKAQVALALQIQTDQRDEALRLLRLAAAGPDVYAVEEAKDHIERILDPAAHERRQAQAAAEEAQREAAVAAANTPEALFIDHIHRYGPDTTDVGSFAYEVELYCRYGGPRCQAMRVRSRNFQDQRNRAAEQANLRRIWQTQGPGSGQSLGEFGERLRARSQCLQRLTESIRRHTSGHQNWRYTGECG